jgi:Family of unknown function (DUF6158)
MAGKFGLDPHRLDDDALERELRYLYATREETFFHGTRQALLNHTERMLQLEREYANRFPERTRADALRTRKGARIQVGQPTATPRTPKSTTRRDRWPRAVEAPQLNR